MKEHLVIPGDTIWRISSEFDLPESFVNYYNGIGRNEHIHVGRVISSELVEFMEHVIAPGQTVSSIASDMGIEESFIRALNAGTIDETPGTRIKVGKNPNTIPVTYRKRTARYDIANAPADPAEKRYCMLPFIFMGLAHDHVMPCTWIDKLHEECVVPLPEATDLKKIWNSEQFKHVRQTIIDGDYHHCHLQFCPQYQGEQNHFLTIDEVRTKYPDAADCIEGKTDTLNSFPRDLNLGHDTTCNLACPSCNNSILEHVDRKIVQEITESISTISDDLDFLFVSGHGDPFASKIYHGFLADMDLEKFPHLKHIHLNTNGLLWTAEKWEAIPGHIRKLVKSATLSIDGASEATYNVNRKGGKFSRLLERLEYIKTLNDSKEIDSSQITFIYQDNNYHEIMDMINMAKRYSFSKICIARISNWIHEPEEEFAKKDVASPRHPNYPKLMEQLELARKAEDQSLKIVIT